MSPAPASGGRESADVAAGFAVARYSDAAEGRMGKDERGRIALTKITLCPNIAFAGLS